ncbi:MAG: hypothetical protein ACYTEZ_01640, partial [Planctomycetota bacterium]
MSDQAAPRQRIRRRRYIVDWRLQLNVTAHLLGVLAGIALLHTLAVFVLPGPEALAAMDGEKVRQVLVRANVIYFTLACAILAVVALLLTHRIAGPAFVLERAIRSMRQGDFSQRIHLRQRDHLKPLAAALDQLRREIGERERERSRILADLERCLQERDLDAARELMERLEA